MLEFFLTTLQVAYDNFVSLCDFLINFVKVLLGYISSVYDGVVYLYNYLTSLPVLFNSFFTCLLSFLVIMWAVGLARDLL